MTRVSAAALDAPAVPRTGLVSQAAAFYLLASITMSFLAGSSAPTPLYPLYQAQWGFSPVTVTVVFGIYALALLAALLVAGRLSDHVGRRPVLIAATAMQAATMLVFASADGVSGLLFARIVQGLSTGAAIAAVGAGMLDLDKARGAVANAVAPPLGTAFGALAGGVMVHTLPAPTQMVYLVFAVVFVLQGLGVWLMAETNTPRPGAWASLTPRFSLPFATRRPMLLAVPVLVAAWSLAGFYASLGPGLVHGVFGLDSSLLGGVALFVLAGSGAASVLWVHGRSPSTTMSFGAAALLAGVAVIGVSLATHAAALYFVGTAIAGTGFGAGFQGAVRSVVAFATPRESAGVLSIVFVVSYLAMGVPAVGAGWLVAHGGNILRTGELFATVVMALAALALLGAMLRRSGRPASSGARPAGA